MLDVQSGAHVVGCRPLQSASISLGLALKNIETRHFVESTDRTRHCAYQTPAILRFQLPHLNSAWHADTKQDVLSRQWTCITNVGFIARVPARVWKPYRARQSDCTVDNYRLKEPAIKRLRIAALQEKHFERLRIKLQRWRSGSRLRATIFQERH